MQSIAQLYFDHPFWVWLALAAVLLALELPTSTGWLLWPSASAAAVALWTLTGVRLGWGGEVALYAVLTIVTTLASRRFMPRRADPSPDINDRSGQLPGKTGTAVDAFKDGSGRVLVDGAEWDAEIEFGDAPAPGARIEVVRVLGGSKLAVRAL